MKIKTLSEIEQQMHEKHQELARIHDEQAKLLEREGAVRTELQHLEIQRGRLQQLGGNSADE